MGSELNGIRRENEWEKQREPLVLFFLVNFSRALQYLNAWNKLYLISNVGVISYPDLTLFYTEK